MSVAEHYSLHKTILIYVLVSVSLVLGYIPFHHREATEQYDLTKQASLVRSLKLSGTATIVISKNSVIEYWDSNAEELFGYSTEEALGRQLPDLIMLPDHPAKAQHVAGVDRVFEHGLLPGVRHMDCKAVTKGGDIVHVSIRIHVPFDDNSILALVDKFRPPHPPIKKKVEKVPPLLDK